MGMREQIIADRYSKALQRLVVERKDDADRAMSELASVVELLEQNSVLRKLMINPSVPEQHKQGIFARIADGLKLSDSVKQFLSYMIKRGRLNIVETVNRRFRKMMDDALGRVEVDVRTAFDLSDTDRASLERAMGKVTGKKPALTITRDESLIGGFVAKIGSMVYDGSIRNQLAELGIKLKSQSGGTA